ncbi:MAG: flagellar hook-length control protein FliK [Schwartzia sp.]|nr:flagellar hook-length control protein FliK [Schwartzia sp. (in: firmicutes)]
MMKAANVSVGQMPARTDAGSALHAATKVQTASQGAKAENDTFRSALGDARNARKEMNAEAPAKGRENPKAEAVEAKDAQKPAAENRDVRDTQGASGTQDAKALEDAAKEAEAIAKAVKGEKKDKPAKAEDAVAVEADASDEAPEKSAPTTLNAMLLAMAGGTAAIPQEMQAAEVVDEGVAAVETVQPVFTAGALDALLPQDAAKEQQAVQNQQLMDMLSGNGAELRLTSETMEKLTAQTPTEEPATAQEPLPVIQVQQPVQAVRMTHPVQTGVTAVEQPAQAETETTATIRPAQAETETTATIRPAQAETEPTATIQPAQAETEQTATIQPAQAETGRTAMQQPVQVKTEQTAVQQPVQTEMDRAPVIDSAQLARETQTQLSNAAEAVTERPETAEVFRDTPVFQATRPVMEREGTRSSSEGTEGLLAGARITVEDVRLEEPSSAGQQNLGDMLRGQEQPQPQTMTQSDGTVLRQGDQLPENADFDTAEAVERGAGQNDARHAVGANVPMQGVSFQEAMAAADVQNADQPRETDPYGVMRQIVDQARLIRSDTNTEMVIRLNPRHLGELTLRVAVTAEGAVNASFHTENAQVRALLESSMVQLKQELQQQGIKVDNVNVSSGMSEDFFAQSQAGQQGYPQSQQSARNQTAARAAFEDDAEALSAVQAPTGGAEDTGTAAGETEGVNYLV